MPFIDTSLRHTGVLIFVQCDEKITCITDELNYLETLVFVLHQHFLLLLKVIWLCQNVLKTKKKKVNLRYCFVTSDLLPLPDNQLVAKTKYKQPEVLTI